MILATKTPVNIPTSPVTHSLRPAPWACSPLRNLPSNYPKSQPQSTKKPAKINCPGSAKTTPKTPAGPAFRPPLPASLSNIKDPDPSGISNPQPIVNSKSLPPRPLESLCLFHCHFAFCPLPFDLPTPRGAFTPLAAAAQIQSPSRLGALAGPSSQRFSVPSENSVAMPFAPWRLGGTLFPTLLRTFAPLFYKINLTQNYTCDTINIEQYRR